jgi:hypothetical protein
MTFLAWLGKHRLAIHQALIRQKTHKQTNIDNSGYKKNQLLQFLKNYEFEF